jgi:hypothetical protein
MRRLASACLLLLAACSGAGGPGYETLMPDGEPLRAAFNAGAGKVRAIFLASPT